MSFDEAHVVTVMVAGGLVAAATGNVITGITAGLTQHTAALILRVVPEKR